jgi:hypothetical protein
VRVEGARHAKLRNLDADVKHVDQLDGDTFALRADEQHGLGGKLGRTKVIAV